MEETEEQKAAREVAEAEAAAAGGSEEETPDEKAAKEQDELDRPIKNLQAENERKQREIEELRERINRSTSGYNPQDMTTWDDKQLQALRYAPDVQPQFKAQAEEIIMDRRVDRKMQAEREREKRESFEIKRLEEFPESFDSSHPMSLRMNKIAREMGLDSTPSGRYAAARLAASELKPRKPNVKALAEAERERVAAIKAGKTSRDQGGSQPATKQKYEETLKKAGRSDDAFMEALRMKGGGKVRDLIIPLSKQ